MADFTSALGKFGRLLQYGWNMESMYPCESFLSGNISFFLVDLLVIILLLICRSHHLEREVEVRLKLSVHVGNMLDDGFNCQYD